MMRTMLAARFLRALCSDEMTTSRWSHGMAVQADIHPGLGTIDGVQSQVDPVIAPIIDGKWRPGDKSRLCNILLLFVLHAH